MTRVVGIDPGTGSWDLVGLEDGALILDVSIPTRRVLKNPRIIVDILKSLKEVDMVVAPSGFGLPLKKVSEISDADIFLMTLKREGKEEIVGLTSVIKLLIEEEIPAYVIPGVKHLPTVPIHRKVNKIDMGTADKVCVAALAIVDQSENLQIPIEETRFILIESGTGFNAVLAIDDGRIIDGIGGAEGHIGLRACGALDAELAYLMGSLLKTTIYKGGAVYIAGCENATPEELFKLAEYDERVRIAIKALTEGLIKDVFSLLAVLQDPREILVSGRLARISTFLGILREYLVKIAPVRTIKGFARVAKEAAQGAAIIADGLSGGIYKKLVDVMKIKEAAGTVLDHIFFDEIESLRSKFTSGARM